MPRAIMTFTTVTTNADGDPSETELHADVGGHLEVKEDNSVREREFDDVIILWLFIPDQHLATLTRGMKVVDANSKKYLLHFVEDFTTHQEIVLREI